MTEWFHQYNLSRCPSCLVRGGCNSVQHELVYLRKRDTELRRREHLDATRNASMNYVPLNLSLKEALIRG